MTDTQPIRRSTFTAEPTPATSTEETKLTIAETREAATKELRERVKQLRGMLEEERAVYARDISKFKTREGELRESFKELKAAQENSNGEHHADRYGIHVFIDERANGNGKIVQIDTPADIGNLAVLLNDSTVFDANPEVCSVGETDQDGPEEVVYEKGMSEDAEGPGSNFFAIVETHLSTHGQGAQAILQEVQRRGIVEQAGYIASIDRLAEAMQQNTDNLRDLAQRSRVAQALTNE